MVYGKTVIIADDLWDNVNHSSKSLFCFICIFSIFLWCNGHCVLFAHLVFLISRDVFHLPISGVNFFHLQYRISAPGRDCTSFSNLAFVA